MYLWVFCALGLSVNALSSPCYGYGTVMGVPSAYFKSDYLQVVENKIGNITD